MSLSISMGIGCYVDSLEDLPKSYEMAAEVLKYRYSKGIGVIIDCEAGNQRGEIFWNWNRS